MSNKQVADFERLDKDFMGHPKPLRSLFFVEMWERFSYYGIRPLLILFMTATLASGGLGLSDEKASAIYGIFVGMMYLMPLAGGYLADNWLGQEKSLWWGSIIIALGHLAIGLSAVMGVNLFYLGLIFLVIGSGLFKTCISVMVGALYDMGDGRRDGGFTLFYMGINLGALIAPLITGFFQEKGMWHMGFSVGGVGMLLALLIYRFITRANLREFATAKGETPLWDSPKTPLKNIGKVVMGVSVAFFLFVGLVMAGVMSFNPVAVAEYLTYIVSLLVIGYFVVNFASPKLTKGEKMRLLVCFCLVVGSTLFWASFEQQPTSFNLFADRYTDLNVFGMQIPSVWFQSLNPLFVIMFAPVLSMVWVKLAKRGINPSSMAKFGVAMFLTAFGFVLMYFASRGVVNHAGSLASAWWLVGSLLFLTIGELMLSPVGIASATKLAPVRMQGQIVGLWFTSMAVGGLVASFSGKLVSAQTIDQLPKLFMTLTIFLVVVGAIMLILSKPIAKLLKNADNTAEA